LIQDKDRLEFQENEIILNDIQSSYGDGEPQIDNPDNSNTPAFNDQVVTKAEILKDLRTFFSPDKKVQKMRPAKMD
jgi:hypothetical protein